MLLHHATKRNRGLAPLEMVLAIPFLLGILALMVCFGNAVCWKIRALTVARHSLWGNMSPNLNSPWVYYDRKTGDLDPRPAYWPQNNANSGAGGAGNAAGGVDDPRADLPVARGPVFQGLSVNSELLNPARDMRSGTADVTRPFPMLKSLGNFRLRAETYSLDNAWRSAEMGIPNVHYRLQLLYVNFRPPTGSNPVLEIMMAMYGAVQQGRLNLLYGADPGASADADFIQYQTLYGVPAPRYISSIPDWTRLHLNCTMDSTEIQTKVDDLVDRIQGSKRKSGPLRDLTNALIGYYQSVKGRIQIMQNSPNPPVSPQQMQNDLDTLDGYIDQLNQFSKTL